MPAVVHSCCLEVCVPVFTCYLARCCPFRCVSVERGEVKPVSTRPSSGLVQTSGNAWMLRSKGFQGRLNAPMLRTWRQVWPGASRTTHAELWTARSAPCTRTFTEPWVVIAAVSIDQPTPYRQPTITRRWACLMSHQVLSQSEKGEEAAGQVVDARSLARFKAEAPEPRAGVAGGHVPGSACVPFAKVLVDGDVNR